MGYSRKAPLHTKFCRHLLFLTQVHDDTNYINNANVCDLFKPVDFFSADGHPMIFHWFVHPVQQHIKHNLRLKLTLRVPEHHTITPKIQQICNNQSPRNKFTRFERNQLNSCWAFRCTTPEILFIFLERCHLPAHHFLRV